MKKLLLILIAGVLGCSENEEHAVSTCEVELEHLEEEHTILKMKHEYTTKVAELHFMKRAEYKAKEMAVFFAKEEEESTPYVVYQAQGCFMFSNFIVIDCTPLDEVRFKTRVPDCYVVKTCQ